MDHGLKVCRSSTLFQRVCQKSWLRGLSLKSFSSSCSSAPAAHQEEIPVHERQPVRQVQYVVRLIGRALRKIVHCLEKCSDNATLPCNHCVAMRLSVMHADYFKRLDICVEGSVHSLSNE